MKCYYCKSNNLRTLTNTKVGYKQWQCKICGSKFNERTGTIFNRIQCRTERIIFSIYCHVHLGLSFRKIANILLLLGTAISHEEVRKWEEMFSSVLTNIVIKISKRKITKKWYVDEMFFDIDTVRYYFYRCIDSKGNLVGCYLGKRKNTDEIIRFLKLCKHNSKLIPSEIVTDGYVCYNLAIPLCFDNVKHTMVKPSRNYIEQDNRWIRQRANSFIGLKKYYSTNSFFNLFEQLKNYFRIKKYKNQFVSL